MMDRHKHLVGPLVLVGMFLFPAFARAGDAKVGVIDTIQASLGMKLNARQAVASALDELGVAMVPLEDMTPEDAACTDSECFMASAKRVGATHLLLVSGVANPAGYRLTLDVRDGDTGRSLGTDGKDCELCAEDQFASTLQERVTKLWKRVAREDARAQAASSSRKLRPVVGDTESRPVKADGDSPIWTQRTPMMGLGLGVVGLLGIGFGAYYIAVDGNAVEMSHPGDPMKSVPIVVRDTGKWGWTFVGLGAVSLVAGSAMVIWGRDDGTHVSVAVGPRSLGLQGKF
jgi:hypothetical protein